MVTKNQNKKIAAFFDIDGTLFRKSLLIEHFKKLIKNNDIDKKYWENEIKPLYEKYETRTGGYEEYLVPLTYIYQEELIGIDKDYLQNLASQVIDENKDIVYKTTRNKIKEHKENDVLIFFISGSPNFLVEKFAKHYDATLAIGSYYIFDENNKFTGKLEKMWDSESKKKSVQYLVEKYNIDLDKSFAYGDTSGDFSILESVGHPCAINPSFELLDSLEKDKTLREKVRVYIERKDVRYSFNLRDKIVGIEEF